MMNNVNLTHQMVCHTEPFLSASAEKVGDWVNHQPEASYNEAILSNQSIIMLFSNSNGCFIVKSKTCP